MDEPTSGLDPLVQRGLNEFLASETDRGLTAFLSSHVLSEVRRVCDRVVVLRAGRLVTTERVEDLLHRTGKVVRVGVAGDVDPAAFDLDGAHDVTCSTTDGSERRETDESGSAPDADATADGTATDRTGGTDPRGPLTECTFTFTGDVNDLVGEMSEYRLIDLDVEEAPLEAVLVRFYGGGESGA